MQNRFAVIIGVDDYARFALATGAHLRQYDLPGPTNDAIAWFNLLGRVGVDPARTRVLTSNKVTEQQLQTQGVVTGNAVTGELDRTLDWLVAELKACEGPASATVVFSGHGDFLASNGGALFPADYVGTAQTALFLTDWAERIDALGRDDITLTAFVDACREGGGPLVSALPTKAGPPAHAVWTARNHILASACRSGQLTRSRCIQGQWRSVFSWVVEILTGEWTTFQAKGNGPYITLSYADLMQRADRMVAAMSSDADAATPTLYASPRSAALAFGQPPGSAQGETDEDPDTKAPGHELPIDSMGVIASSGNNYVGFGANQVTWVNGSPTTSSEAGAIWVFASGAQLPLGSDFNFRVWSGLVNPQNFTHGQPFYYSTTTPVAFGTPTSTTVQEDSANGFALKLSQSNQLYQAEWYFQTGNSFPEPSPVQIWDFTQASAPPTGWNTVTDTLIPLFGGLGGNNSGLVPVGGQTITLYTPSDPNVLSGVQIGTSPTYGGSGSMASSITLAPNTEAIITVYVGTSSISGFGGPNGLGVIGLTVQNSSGQTISVGMPSEPDPSNTYGPYSISTMVLRSGASVDAIGGF